ncbi:MAG: Flp pilus assembly complex ATPase component TadA [Gammaproteobacteria bacterium]|nr:Flp pilus assembly complex ATPase component TadA [Gammaproteobacteria bacterium]MBQ0838775.1 Flp pilus assembly complex ATPase component TadA [Gammaproteobacteria bacterium]
MNAPAPARKRIGDQLIDSGVISADQLSIAVLEQKRSGERLGGVLVRLGFLTESVLKEALGEHLGQDSVNLREVVPDSDAIALISKSLAVKLKVMPVSYLADQQKLLLAMPDTFDILTIDRISAALPEGVNVEPLLASEQEVMLAIDQFYGFELSIDGILHEIETGEFDIRANEFEGKEFSHPTVRLVDAFLTDAVKKDASDIHFEPEEGFLRVRYRIDGVLRQVRSLHRKYWPAIVVRLKVLAGMNIAEVRAPQDGHMSLKITGHPIDFRVASQPTLHGENVVLRILDRSKAIVPLDELDISDYQRNLLKLMMARPEGIILVTGPTGSGKTTTLYSLLNYLNDESVNIMTLEDPVEYPMPMIRQSSLNSAVKMDFAGGIRSLMRQDPDIILVGEMRDADTANMGFRAAMTGHQVFSTLHTNSALGAFLRLRDIGVEPSMMAGNIIGLVGQRLVRKLCHHCRREDTPTDLEIQLLNTEAGAPDIIYRAEGCDKCEQRGYKGRMALLEILKMDEDLDELVAQQAPMRELSALATSKGYLRLVDDAITRVRSGDTTIDEVSRVIDFSARLGM